MNIDGIQAKPKHISKQNSFLNQPKPHFAERQVLSAPYQQRTKAITLTRFIDKKQAATIAITFLVTFIFSIATSRGLASYNNYSDPQKFSSDISVDPTFQVISQPDQLTLDDQVLSQPGEVFLPKEKISLPDPLKKRKEFLEKYLKSKNSPLADHVEAISEQSQWKLIIAISRAESSFCKHQVTNNCWGIGGAWNMKNYQNFDQAVADVNRILEEHYIQAGLNTPKSIVKKYVGHQNDNWQLAVEQELQNLSEVQ
ncbi:MAG: hypothetical protein JWO40_123 [Candidatus Doudnabacteria bacterium]|nr:hypothetical protein [Candidatus Doudnabacteria bacterium]